jgi:hypothetical protein
MNCSWWSRKAISLLWPCQSLAFPTFPSSFLSLVRKNGPPCCRSLHIRSCGCVRLRRTCWEFDSEMFGRFNLGPISHLLWCHWEGALTLSQMDNSFGQDPCLVGAKLIASEVCYDQDFTMFPLEKDHVYFTSLGSYPVPACMCNDEICPSFRSRCALG